MKREEYTVAMDWQAGERIFAVVAPTGQRMYSFANRFDAEADVAALNGRLARQQDEAA